MSTRHRTDIAIANGNVDFDIDDFALPSPFTGAATIGNPAAAVN